MNFGYSRAILYNDKIDHEFTCKVVSMILHLLSHKEGKEDIYHKKDKIFLLIVG